MGKEITLELENYIKTFILPIYQTFDGAHNISHVNKVINKSLEIALEYDVSNDMVYAIAAYHDIGLINGRENHHLDSGKIVLEDLNLKKWFSQGEIEIISNAVIDHRASNDYEPRSIYGKIIAESDRDLSYENVLKRTIKYSLEKYPNFTDKEHTERVVNHIKQKYGENGYLKLWLKTNENSTNLGIIQEKLSNLEVISYDISNYLIRNSKEDFFINKDNNWARIRSCGIIIENNSILMITNKLVDYFYSIGGAIKIGESSREACIREVFEETGVNYEIDYLAFIHENFFLSENQQECHEIAFYYLMKSKGILEFNNKSYGIFGSEEALSWIPIDQYHKNKAYPEFFKDELTKLSPTIKHIITNEKIKKP